MPVACRDAVSAAPQHQHTTHLRQHNPTETTCDTRHTQNPNPKHACVTHAYKRSEAYNRVTLTLRQRSENSPFSHAHDTTNTNTTQRTTHTASTQPHEARTPHTPHASQSERANPSPLRNKQRNSGDTRLVTQRESDSQHVTQHQHTTTPRHATQPTPHHTNTTKHNKPHDTTNTTHETQPTQHKIIDQHSDWGDDEVTLR